MNASTPYIQCGGCDRRSHNSNDISNKFCSVCGFLEDQGIDYTLSTDTPYIPKEIEQLFTEALGLSEEEFDALRQESQAERKANPKKRKEMSDYLVAKMSDIKREITLLGLDRHETLSEFIQVAGGVLTMSVLSHCSNDREIRAAQLLIEKMGDAFAKSYNTIATDPKMLEIAKQVNEGKR